MSWFQSKEDQLIDEIQNGDVAKVTKLINSGANINYRQEKGQLSPLNAAVEKRNVELIQMLISKGAEVNSKTRNGYSSLMVALSSLECKFDVVDILIRNGADVNAQSFKEKWSPLLLAAAQLNANNKVIQRLVEAGALVDASNIFGATLTCPQ